MHATTRRKNQQNRQQRSHNSNLILAGYADSHIDQKSKKSKCKSYLSSKASQQVRSVSSLHTKAWAEDDSTFSYAKDALNSAKKPSMKTNFRQS